VKGARHTKKSCFVYFHLHKIPRKEKSTEAESRLMVARSSEKRVRGISV
jgi:hypothetical protein